MRLKTAGCVLAVLLALVCFAFIANADMDPFPVQNRFPLHLLFLTPRPTSARLPSQGALRMTTALEYSSVYADPQNSQWNFLLDMETMVLDLSLTYGLTSKMAIRLDVPVVGMYSGFMDGFLEAYHDALGVPNYGREARPANSFAYRVDKDGQPWVQGESGLFQLADMTLSGQWLLFRMAGNGTWRGTLLASIKLPTGDAGRGYGSGRLDMGLFVPSQWDGTQWVIYLMPGLMWHTDPQSRGADVKARNSFSFLVGTGYKYNERWSWLAQLNYFSSPIEKTDLALLDDGAVELALGVRHRYAQTTGIEFVFCEDLFTRAAPDFNVRLGWVWEYGDQAVASK